MKKYILFNFLVLLFGHLKAQTIEDTLNLKEVVITYQADKKTPVTFQNIYSEELDRKLTGQEPSFIFSETLVEIIGDIPDRKGLRLWVVAHERDFDGTPLYALSFDKDWSPIMYGEPFKNTSRFRIDGGYTSEILKVI